MTAALSTPAGYQPAPDALAGRVILITGASGGLGRATAEAVARLGATAVLLGRTVKDLEAVYDAIEQAGGPTPAIYPMDLIGATYADLFELATTIERSLGRLDGIAHCAAHFRAHTPLHDEAPKDWMDGLQVNLTAAHMITRLCLPLLQKAADASVVFVGDPAGRTPKALRGVYGVTKAALESLSASWALEQDAWPQLRFNTYDPGPMRTRLRARGYLREVVDTAPPPQAATPGLLWLLGPDSRGRSGQAWVQG